MPIDYENPPYKSGREVPWSEIGLDPAFLLSIGRNIAPNPITGRVEMGDVAQYLYNNQTPEVMQLFQNVGKVMEKNQDIDLSTFDYASLASTIKPGTTWYITMESSGLLDPNTKCRIDPAKAHTVPGCQVGFELYCDYITPTTGTSKWRYVDTVVGLPTSKDILKYIQRTIAQPIPLFKPNLPTTLIITNKLQQHEEYLKPFLDSLPAPFEWFVINRDTADLLDNVAYVGSRYRFKEYMSFAMELKVEGNDAYKRKDRTAAVEAYTESLRILGLALVESVEGERDEVNNLAAICHTNRAASYLIKDEETNPWLALEDAKKAIAANPRYNKGYLRLSQAYELQGNILEAKKVIAGALRLPALENDKFLVNYIFLVQTGGKGLPQTKTEFDIWMEDNADVMEGVNGEWRRRVYLRANSFI